MKTLATVNYKGGTGKTTITYHLAHAIDYLMNEKEKKPLKILLIDNDPQASLTKLFYNPEEDFEAENTIMSIYSEKPVYSDKIIYETRSPNIDLVPNLYLTVRKNDILSSSMDGLFRLKNFIGMLDSKYGLIIIDNNPTATNFTKNCFMISDYVIIPSEPTKMSSEGIKEILEDLDIVRNNINGKLKLLGIIINRIDTRYSNHKIFREALIRTFGNYILDSEIKQRAALQNAERYRKPITDYKNENSYREFISLAREVLNKMGFPVKFDSEKVIREKFAKEERDES